MKRRIALLIACVSTVMMTACGAPSVPEQIEVEVPEATEQTVEAVADTTEEVVEEEPAEEPEEEETGVIAGNGNYMLGGLYKSESGDRLEFNWFTIPEEEGYPWIGSIHGTVDAAEFNFLVLRSDNCIYALEEESTQSPVSIFLTADMDENSNIVLRMYDGNNNLMQKYTMDTQWIS